jgi:hypothetical protein
LCQVECILPGLRHSAAADDAAAEELPKLFAKYDAKYVAYMGQVVVLNEAAGCCPAGCLLAAAMRYVAELA